VFSFQFSVFGCRVPLVGFAHPSRLSPCVPSVPSVPSANRTRQRSAITQPPQVGLHGSVLIIHRVCLKVPMAKRSRSLLYGKRSRFPGGQFPALQHNLKWQKKQPFLQPRQISLTVRPSGRTRRCPIPPPPSHRSKSPEKRTPRVCSASVFFQRVWKTPERLCGSTIGWTGCRP